MIGSKYYNHFIVKMASPTSVVFILYFKRSTSLLLFIGLTFIFINYFYVPDLFSNKLRVNNILYSGALRSLHIGEVH